MTLILLGYCGIYKLGKMAAVFCEIIIIKRHTILITLFMMLFLCLSYFSSHNQWAFKVLELAIVLRNLAVRKKVYQL